MACFAGIGHGADPWSTRFIDDRSREARPGASKSEVKIVGAPGSSVMRSRSISSITASASNVATGYNVAPVSSPTTMPIL